ncbi:DUF4876 domain-containing protein [Saccharicrinis sp. FJH54]|uniref:DUF4876 domain-containing protein n=1 Tax=Saccharicrinis sp. FJH54 TaxID=3344665 RepID=UPI0035D47C2B
MKKLIYIVLIILWLTGCNDEFDRNPVSLSLQVNFNEQFGSVAVGNIPVKLRHLQKDVSVTVQANSEGQLVFENLDPGFYSLSTSVTISPEHAEFISQEYFIDSLVLNANKIISVLESTEDTLIIVPAFKSDLIIREFYYSGSYTNSGDHYFADQYLELYNNSDKTIDISGIIIAKHESVGYGYNRWSYIKDSVVVDMLWQIPENTNQNLLFPGNSIVIARDAINHKDDPNGNVNSPVDLSSANFEFYVIFENKPDLDSPAENLKELFTMEPSQDITFFVKFGGGLMILDPKTDDVEAFITEHKEKVTYPNGHVRYVVHIPNTWVIDAIDVLENENAEAFKRFPESLDAGFTYNGTKGSGTCISRKLVSDVDGRKVFRDTNNSTYDFLNHQVPNPGLNE